MTPTAVSDAELLTQARDGDEAAFTELYVRHQAAAQRLANAYSRAGDPEDLVNESFERVLAALRRGAGPTEAFRAYLFVTLRRLAADRIARRHDEPVDEVPEPVRAEEINPPLDPADRQLVVTAYESLPERWQAVLWQTAVEGRQPRDLAPGLGMTPNAAAALAYRAREKLRQAYLQAHLQAAPRPACEPHRSRLGAYVRDGLSRRDRTATELHLDDCSSCRGLVGELADVNRMLVRSLIPIFGLAAAAEAALAAAVGGAAPAAGAGAAGGAGGGSGSGSGLSGVGGLGRRLATKAKSNPAVVAGAVLAAALAFALVSSRGDEEVAQLPDPDSPSREQPGAGPGAPPDPDDPDAPESEDPEEPPRLIVPIMSVSPTTVPGTPPTSGPGSPSTPSAPGVDPPPGSPGPGPTPPPTEGPTPSVPTTEPPPPPTDPPPPTEPPHGTPYLVVVWLDDIAELRITLHNPTGQSTSPLVVKVELTAGANARGNPSGCGLLTTLLSGSSCGLSSVGPGGSRTLTVGVDVTGSQPTARVSVCEARLLSLNCNGGLLGNLVTALI